MTDVEAVRAAVGAQGPFEILVNNAGVNRPGPMTGVTPEDFDFVMGVNVRAAYFVAQAVLEGMIEAGRGGSIVNTSSQMGLVGGVDRTVYCASKFADRRHDESAVDRGGTARHPRQHPLPDLRPHAADRADLRRSRAGESGSSRRSSSGGSPRSRT